MIKIRQAVSNIRCILTQHMMDDLREELHLLL